jgi:Bacterial Ig-like domain (group 3)
MRLKKLFNKRDVVVILALLLLASLQLSSVMAAISPLRNAGAGSDVTLTGTTQVWQNPNNITAPVGSPYATVTLNKNGQFSHYLRATNYGFSVPGDATITGIMVVINRQSSGNNPSIIDNVVSLVKAGSVVGQNKNSALAWPSSMGTATYGGSTDLWGTTWTPAEINATDFGVVLAAYRQNSGNNDRTASVDYIQVSVYYTEPTTTSVDCGNGTPQVTYGGVISCEVTVTALSESGTPTGSVDWTSDGSGTFSSKSCSLAGSGGTATCSVTYTPDAVGTGAHLISAAYVGDTDFSSSTGSESVTVNKAAPSCTVTAYNITYDGNQHTATGTCTGVKTEDLSSLLDLSGTIHTNAGDYPTDAWSFAGNANYNSSSGTVHDQIAKANATITVNPYSLAYDGNSHIATGTATGVKAEDLNSLFDLIGTSHTDAGDYPADAWSFSGDTNYNSANGTVHDQITKANATLSVIPYNVTYDGDSHTATGTATGAKGEDLSSLLDLTGTTHTNAGDYPTDAWTFAGNTNYSNAGGTIHDAIAKADPLCDIVPYNVGFDGKPHTASGACTGIKDETLAGLDLSGTTHTFIGNYSDSWSFTDATGNYKNTGGNITDVITGYRIFIPLMFR